MFAKISMLLLLFFLVMIQVTPSYSNGEKSDLRSTISTNKTSSVNLTGLWTGKWSSAVFGDAVSLSLTQTGANISGTLTLGLDCFSTGKVSGTYTGGSFHMEVRSSDESILIYTGSLSDKNSASGSWTQKSGNCPLSNGNWTMSRQS